MNKLSSAKAIAFDVFGTVLDFSRVPREEREDYGRQLKRDPWEPIVLPKSWEKIPAHRDAKEGLERLRYRYKVVTLSNGPLELLMRASKFNGLRWDAVIPIECAKVAKPKPRAYEFAVELLDVLTRGIAASDVMMVTANPGFGDVEASRGIGMQAQVIRHEDDPEFPEWKGCPKDIIELAERLGC